MDSENFWDWVSCIMFLVIGVMAVFTAIQGLNKTLKLKKNGLAAIGRIIKIEEDNNDGQVFYPIIEFKTLTGFVVKRRMDGRSNNNLELGEEVEVFYDSDKPNDFIVNTNFESKYKYYIAFVTGIGFFGVGIYKCFSFINN